jgi:hypothetical protein
MKEPLRNKIFGPFVTFLAYLYDLMPKGRFARWWYRAVVERADRVFIVDMWKLNK